MKPCFKRWIASELALLAMTRKVAMKGKVAMLEEMDCFVASASRNDEEGRNDGKKHHMKQ